MHLIRARSFLQVHMPLAHRLVLSCLEFVWQMAMHVQLGWIIPAHTSEIPLAMLRAGPISRKMSFVFGSWKLDNWAQNMYYTNYEKI